MDPPIIIIGSETGERGVGEIGGQREGEREVGSLCPLVSCKRVPRGPSLPLAPPLTFRPLARLLALSLRPFVRKVGDVFLSERGGVPAREIRIERGSLQNCKPRPSFCTRPRLYAPSLRISAPT